MQNKPNFQKAKMNITSAITKDYENIPPTKKCENKPNFIPPKPRGLRSHFGEEGWRRRTNPTCSELVEPISAQKCGFHPAHPRNFHLNSVNLVNPRNSKPPPNPSQCRLLLIHC